VLRFAIPVVMACGVLATEARGVVHLFLQDECDDRDAIWVVREAPAVKQFRRQMDAFTDRLRPLKEQDITALFGKPTPKPAKAFAMPVAQPRVLALSGLRYADEKKNKDHTEFYIVGDFAAIEVYYQLDGVSPAAILLYFRADEKFPKLTKNNLDRRLEWEQERLGKLIEFFERRRAVVFVWEVDEEQEKNQYQGIDSGDFGVKLSATLRWGEQQGYRLVHRPAKDERTPRWSWYHGDTLMAEAYHDRGFKGTEAHPTHFLLYRPDGTLLRDDMGWPSLEMVRWYRRDGLMVRSEGGFFHKGSWRPTAWSWYTEKENAVRSEWDTNGDGVPDTHRAGDSSDRDPGLPLAVEQSWAIHPKLIPEKFSIPGQSDRRVPLRKIKQ
jgi:hypothetical protein